MIDPASASCPSKYQSEELLALTLAYHRVTREQITVCLKTHEGQLVSSSVARDIAKSALQNVFSGQLWDQAAETIEQHANQRIHVIPWGTQNYPERLARIPSPPNILFAKGNLNLLDHCKNVAIVGSRAASDYGIKVAHRVTGHYTEQGYGIVSGLALGIDTAAHTACLNHRGGTIAVLAHGLQMIHPRANSRLAQQIVDHNGLLVSEYPLGTEIKRPYFFIRNRIQVGLSAFSIVIEAKMKGGTLGHANDCIKAQHPLYVILPHIENEEIDNCFAGNRWLYEQKGAIPIRSASDYP